MSKFRLVPTSKGANRGIYLGRIDQYDQVAEAWVVASESNQVLFEWRGSSGVPSTTTATAEAVGASVLHPASNTPDILSFSADDVETLQLGSMVPFAIFSETGQLLDMPGLSIEEDLVSLDLTEVVGDVRLYVAKWQTKTAPVTSEGQSIQLDGVFRPCGVITEANTIFTEWSQVRYTKGRTYITFDTIPENSKLVDNILVCPETLMHVIKNSSTDTSVNLRGEYPVRTLSSEGVVWSDNSLIRKGTTHVEVQRAFSMISLIAAEWVYKTEERTYKTDTDRVSSESPSTLGDVEVAWSDILGKPGSSTGDIDATVHRILNVLDYNALQRFADAGGTLTRNGLTIDAHKEVTAVDEAGIEVFYIDVSSADSFFIHPTGEYRVEFINRPSFVRTISVLVWNGGIDVSTWYASCDFSRHLESNGLNLLSFQSSPMPGSLDNETQVFGKDISYVSMSDEGDGGDYGDAFSTEIHGNEKHTVNYEVEGTADSRITSHELAYDHTNIPTSTEKSKITNLPFDTNSALLGKQDKLLEGPFENGDKTKLDNLDLSSLSTTDEDIKIAYENNADTNAYTDSEKAKVANVPADTVTELSGKEDSFTKNTAFNKDFGTEAGTVVEGNDERLGGVVIHSELDLDDGSNPHGTTKGDVSLGNVPNVDATNMDNWSQNGATAGQAPIWNDSLGKYVPQDVVAGTGDAVGSIIDGGSPDTIYPA